MTSPLSTQLASTVAAIQAISAVPTILEAIAALTGLRFVCVAHVTKDSWTTCAVLDKLDFGLNVGDGLDVTTTICDEVRDSGLAVVIDNVSESATYRAHATPRMYGFQSYISIPIFRQDGAYFGTLCGLDPLPANLTTPATLNSIKLFAQLISQQLASENTLAQTAAALSDERATAELREQFIAVLGHDVRNPLSSIMTGAQLLLMMPEIGPKATAIAQRMQRSTHRISGLVDDVVDFTRGKMGGGISLNLRHDKALTEVLQQVVAELKDVYPDRLFETNISPGLALHCDSARIAQLLSNLLKNALVHGAPNYPVVVDAQSSNGVFRLSVSNRGEPISASTQAQLFKPFWRGAPAVTSEGLGLGLFIVAEITRAHGGRIDVTSNAAATSFLFTLETERFVERRSPAALAAGRVLERRKAA